MLAAAVGGYLTSAQSGFAQQHAAPGYLVVLRGRCDYARCSEACITCTSEQPDHCGVLSPHRSLTALIGGRTR
jgi:hypothetical protein